MTDPVTSIPQTVLRIISTVTSYTIYIGDTFFRGVEENTYLLRLSTKNTPGE